MLSDPLWGIFKRNIRIDLPDPERLSVARQLEEKGLLSIQEETFVRCVNPLDKDRSYVKDFNCDGRIFITADKDEDDYDYQCPDCGRTIFPRRKQKKRCALLSGQPASAKVFVRELMGCLQCPIDEKPQGVLRARLDHGEVQVCLVDWCWDAALFNAQYPYRDSTIYVVADDRSYQRRVPKEAESFRLADIAITDAVKRFRRRLRQIAKLDEETNGGPAVLSMPVAVAPPMVGSPPKVPALYPGVERIPVGKGKSWGHVAIYRVDGTTVAIRVEGRKMKRYGHVQLGMANKRNQEPTKIWDLLDELCDKDGHIPWTRPSREFNAFKERVSKLRSLLQYIFDIDADPFPTFSRADGLQSAFQAFHEIPKQVYVGEDKWEAE